MELHVYKASGYTETESKKVPPLLLFEENEIIGNYSFDQEEIGKIQLMADKKGILLPIQLNSSTRSMEIQDSSQKQNVMPLMPTDLNV